MSKREETRKAMAQALQRLTPAADKATGQVENNVNNVSHVSDVSNVSHVSDATPEEAKKPVNIEKTESNVNNVSHVSNVNHANDVNSVNNVKERRTARVSLYLTPSSAQALKEAAWRNRQSVNDLLQRLVNDYIKEQEEKDR